MIDPPILHSNFLFDASVSLVSILCTEELRNRPARPADYQKENRALSALAGALVDARSQILQIFAQTLLDVIGCDSSGVSLLTDEGKEFYWPAVAGTWKPHIGGRTQRSCDPSGDALDLNCPLLFRHFERRYTAFLPFIPAAEECLIVPFYADGEAVGTMWAIMHTDRRKFDAEDERIMATLGPFAAAASQTFVSIAAEEQDFRLMVDSIPTLVYTMTPIGEVEFVNRQVLDYFGRTAVELKDWDKIGCVNPDDLPNVLASLKHSIEFGEPHEVQQRLRRADGVYRWFHSRARPLRHADGRLVRWFAALTDIEDLRQAEDAAHAGSDLRQTVDGIPGLVATMTAGGELEFANERILSYTGRTLEQLKDWETIFHPNDRAQQLESWRRSLETGNTCEIDLRIAGADGIYRWFQHRAVPRMDANGRRIRWYVLLTEIDEQKKIEERLRENETFLLEAQRLSHTGSWKHNVATGAVSVTPEITRMYAIAPHEDATTADFFFGRVHPADVPGVAADYSRALLEKRDFAADFRIILGDGSIRYIRNTGHPRLNEAGDVAEVLGTAIDVTEQTLARAELKATINTIPALSWSADPDGSCDFLNQQWLDYTGLTAEQALGFGWSVVIYPEDAKGLLEYWQSALAAGSHVDVEARMRRFDGIYRWFLFRADPLRDESGQIVKWYGTNIDIEDRKRAEDSVRRNERNLRDVINTIPTLSWSTRPDGYVEFLSKRWLDFTGLSEAQAMGFGWAVAIHPDDAPGLVEYWQAALASGAHVDVEARLRRFDGVYRWLLFRAEPLRDDSGQIVKWYGTNFDIEDRKRTEEALRTSEQSLRTSEHNLRLIFDTIPALVCTMSAQGELELVNQQVHDYFGIPLERLRDWSLIGAVHRDDLETVVARWRHSVETGEPYNIEHRIRRADGVYRWFRVSGLPLRDPDGRIVRWYVLLIDSEERHRAELALQASELNLRQMTETIPAMLWSATADGAIDYCNARFLSYTGFAKEEMMNDGWASTIHPDDAARVAPAWLRCVATGKPYQAEVRTFHAADRTYRWCVIAALALLDDQGRILRWHGTVVDFHDRKQAEEELRSTQGALAHMTRVMTMGELTASLAHELSQPLAAVIASGDSCTAWLTSVPPNVNKARTSADRVIQAATQASAVIQRTRTMFRKAPAVRTSLKINEVIDEAISLVQGEALSKRVLLSTELAEGSPLVSADRVQIAQVILNLAMNGIEAIAEMETGPRVLFIRSLSVDNSEINVSVADTGPGFDPNAAARLFDSFFTTKANGIGMGLSISKSIIEAHHGRLWAAKNEPRGAVFHFSLPSLFATPTE